MASRKKPPTNSDLEAKLDLALGHLNKMEKRLGRLEAKRRSDDAYSAALKQVKKEEALKLQQRQHNQEEVTKMKILKEVGKILGLITLALYAYLASKGIHP